MRPSCCGLHASCPRFLIFTIISSQLATGWLSGKTFTCHQHSLNEEFTWSKLDLTDARKSSSQRGLDSGKSVQCARTLLNLFISICLIMSIDYILGVEKLCVFVCQLTLDKHKYAWRTSVFDIFLLKKNYIKKFQRGFLVDGSLCYRKKKKIWKSIHKNRLDDATKPTAPRPPAGQWFQVIASSLEVRC